MSLHSESAAHFQNAIQEKEVMLVDFSTKWCPPCKKLVPILEELEQEADGRLTVLQVDCDELPEVASKYSIMSAPTVIMFYRGEPMEKWIGLRPKSVYQAGLSRYM
ncbi:thioredoxin family protein [Paenibacillus chibensis]|uniref:Thioredoxin n=1 Tax=Paenibacillus chibensis TaxID=59846 RepID=A0ABU6PTU3_9BACL|nr:thioredoxin family protein [Paenibacillus chibensis]